MSEFHPTKFKFKFKYKSCSLHATCVCICMKNDMNLIFIVEKR